MTGRRLLAVLVAAALIAGAWLLRHNVLDDRSDATAAATTTAPAPPAEQSSIVCSPEVRAACGDALRAADPTLAVAVEPAGRTLDRLAAAPDDATTPVWLTIQPYPAMVDALRTAAGRAPLGGSTDVLAASPLAIATPDDGQTDALATACPPAYPWRCIGDHAGAPWTELGGDVSWRTIRPSLGVVEQEATALGSFAAAVAGYLGTPDVSRSAWESDYPSFIAWLRSLAGAVDPSALSGGTPLATMATRAGALDVAATSDAELASLGGTGARFDASYPEPAMWLEAVAAVPDGAVAPGDLGVTATRALVDAGWDGESTLMQALPDASTMIALRALWREAT